MHTPTMYTGTKILKVSVQFPPVQPLRHRNSLRTLWAHDVNILCINKIYWEYL